MDEVEGVRTTATATTINTMSKKTTLSDNDTKKRRRFGRS